jgi:hypothetical protein
LFAGHIVRLERYFGIKEQETAEGYSLEQVNGFFELIGEESESLSRV